MTARIVVDSSVAFKWFRIEGEDSVEAARDLLREHVAGETLVVAPALLAPEVANALLCAGTPSDRVADAAATLDDLQLEVHPLDVELLRRAVHVAGSECHALSDAVFIALAERLDTELVTADRRQARTRACRTRLL